MCHICPGLELAQLLLSIKSIIIFKKSPYSLLKQQLNVSIKWILLIILSLNFLFLARPLNRHLDQISLVAALHRDLQRHDAENVLQSCYTEPDRRI